MCQICTKLIFKKKSNSKEDGKMKGKVWSQSRGEIYKNKKGFFNVKKENEMNIFCNSLTSTTFL